MAKELELKYGCNPNQKPSRIFMADGRVQEQGRPEDIFTNPKNERLQAFLQTVLK